VKHVGGCLLAPGSSYSPRPSHRTRGDSGHASAGFVPAGFPAKPGDPAALPLPRIEAPGPTQELLAAKASFRGASSRSQRRIREGLAPSSSRGRIVHPSAPLSGAAFPTAAFRRHGPSPATLRRASKGVKPKSARNRARFARRNGTRSMARALRARCGRPASHRNVIFCQLLSRMAH